MREIREIVELHQQWPSMGVLMTLVAVTGSSYRRPGAHLLMAANGEYSGLVSGGCLEAEVLRKAEWLVRDGAVVTHYSTLFDETAEMPYGLGCGGEVDLLLEPAGTPEFAAWMDAAKTSIAGERMLVVTLLPEKSFPMARVVWDGDGRLMFASDGITNADEDAIAMALREWMSSDEKTFCARMAMNEIGNNKTIVERRVYSEWLKAPQRLIVLGGGKDAEPVVKFAAELGWRVVVADGRPQMARAERFPAAEQVVVLPMGGDVLAGLEISAGDAVVVMTHSYEQDRRILEALLKRATGESAARYIGLLGARHRSRLLVNDCARALGRSVEKCLERLHVPIGLDLGSDAPESIALAIVAEVQAHLHGRLAGMRSEQAAEELQISMQVPDVAILCHPQLAHELGEE